MNNSAHLLLALEDRDLAAQVGRDLGQAGFGVATAGDAEEANRALAKGNVDVVVLDLDLPGRDPLDLIAEVRGASLAPEVVVTSAAATFEQAVEAMRAGAFDF